MAYVDINEMLATAGDSVTVRVSLDDDASPSALTQVELENLAALKLQAYFKTLIDRKHEREGTDRHREGIATIEKFASWRAPGGKFSSTGTYPSESERAGVGQAAPRAITGKHASWSEYSSSY